MVKLNTALAAMQQAAYNPVEYRRLLAKNITEPPQLTARLRRLKRWSIGLAVLGLGLPALSWGRTVALANRILLPGEKRRNQRFVRRAQMQLTKRPDLIKIGITGSYGKTTVKNILAALLQTKYAVVTSPASFNTPLGFARTVQALTPHSQILIMEMGARHPGDIAEMCELLQPQHGIITSIGPCHLQTFGDIATVARTKAELFAALPADGVAVTDGANPWCQQLTHPNLHLVTPSEHPFVTPLLGQHNQTNIALAVTLAEQLGIDAATIQRVVADLTPTPHRLQKVIAPNGIVILDDSYNANPQSAAAALDVLKTCPGRKVVQTPGFVEQGTNQAAAHRTLAAQIQAVADAVIIVGELNRAALQAALTDCGKPVYCVPNRDAAKPLYASLLAPGDVLLLLNDIPEKY